MGSIQFEDLEMMEKIGEGNFGAVWKCDYLGTTVAVKEIFAIKGWDYKKYMDREASILKEARHPNVVQYMGAVSKSDKFYIVTEFVPGGNLRNWILNNPYDSSSLRLRLSFATDIARALAYLHAHSIIHRDLKGENLLLTENFRLKVCDFGFSRTISDDEKKRLSFCGTDSYMAPEIILCMPFDERVDIFSFGVILCELIIADVAGEKNLCREIPGFGISEKTIKKFAKQDVPQELIDLASSCVDDNPDSRPSWKEILKRLSAIEASLNLTTNVGLIKLDNKTNASEDSIKDGTTTPNTVDTITPISGSESPNKDVLAQQQEINEKSDLGVSSLPGTPELGRRRLGHNIPHRFSYVSGVNDSLSRCVFCKKLIGLSRHLHCDDCGCVAHKSCGNKVPPHCGFSPALQQASFSSLQQ